MKTITYTAMLALVGLFVASAASSLAAPPPPAGVYLQTQAAFGQFQFNRDQIARALKLKNGEAKNNQSSTQQSNAPKSTAQKKKNAGQNNIILPNNNGQRNNLGQNNFNGQNNGQRNFFTPEEAQDLKNQFQNKLKERLLGKLDEVLLPGGAQGQGQNCPIPGQPQDQLPQPQGEPLPEEPLPQGEPQPQEEQLPAGDPLINDLKIGKNAQFPRNTPPVNSPPPVVVFQENGVGVDLKTAKTAKAKASANLQNRSTAGGVTGGVVAPNAASDQGGKTTLYGPNTRKPGKGSRGYTPNSYTPRSRRASGNPSGGYVPPWHR